VALALRTPVDCEPLTALGPDQAPEAVQAVALLDDHAKLAVPPLVIVLGLDARETVGRRRGYRDRRRLRALPPAPAQVSE